MILALFLMYFSNLGMAASHQGACPASLAEKSLSKETFLKKFHCEGALSEGPRKIIEDIQADKDFQSFLAESAQKQTAVLGSKEFQETVSILKDPAIRAQASPKASQLNHPSENANPAELIVFVSFSLGEKALLNLAKEAKLYGATLVLRGFIEGSYLKTAKALQKIIQKTGQGFIIDPELFSLFAVTAVPTTILSRSFQFQTLERTQTPLHDRIQGHITLHYALEQFAKEGDLQEEALSLLEQAKKGGFNE